MKRITAVILALLLALAPLTSFADTQTLDYKGAFTVDYPEKWSFTESTWEYEEEYRTQVGYVTGPKATDLCVYIEIEYWSNWEGYSFTDFDADDKQWYLEQLEDYFSYTKNLHYEWLTTASQAIPVVFYGYTDDGTMRLRAETIINGWYILLDGSASSDATHMNPRKLTDDDEALFKQIAASFVMTAESQAQFDQLMRAE